MKQFFGFLAILCLFNTACAGWLDKSTQAFFPEEEGQIFDQYQKSPIVWWNFFLFDQTQITKENVCQVLQKIDKEKILFSPCSPLPMQKQWLEAWAADFTLRQPPPVRPQELKKQLNRAVVHLSLPLPLEILEIQRNYPLTDFNKISDSFTKFYQVQSGDGPWGIIPILFNFSPKNLEKSKTIQSLLHGHEEILPVGPHFGALANRSLIASDLGKVMLLGALLLIALFSFLLVTKRSGFLLLIPVLFFSIFTSTLLVILTWGSIHGLTLAFGSGLVGISMDYAFHGWPKRHRSQIWGSNSISFLTTFSAFALLSFFSIPLVNQLSLFAASGLTFSFIQIFVLSLVLPEKMRPREIHIPLLKLSRSKTYSFLALLIFISAYSLFFIKFDFSLAKMDSTQQKSPQLLKNSALNSNKNQYAFLVEKFHNYEDLDSEQLWAQSQGLAYFGPSSIRGLEKVAKQNQQAWQDFVCHESFQTWKQSLRQNTLQLFAPFFKKLSCESLTIQTQNMAGIPDYLKLLIADSQYVSIFRVSSTKERESVAKKYPNIFFISDITKKFPEKLKTEVFQFILLIFIVSLFILIFFFKSFALIPFIPVFGSLSFVIVTHALLDHSLSFMSFVALIILLGLTLDYGIFSTSCMKWNHKLEQIFGSISLSALTSIAGFAPLAFCSHPVLQDIGLTITSGILGACLSSFIIFPSLKNKIGGQKHA